MWLQRAINDLAWAYHFAGDNEAAIHHLQEALQIQGSLDDCGVQSIPITYEVSQIHPSGPCALQTSMQDYPMAQSTAQVLCTYAFVLQFCGHYSQAFYSGRDSLTIINALRDKVNALSADFNFWDKFATWLRGNLPAWVGIVRNPAVIEEVDESNEDAESGSSVSHDYIEWGIAI